MSRSAPSPQVQAALAALRERFRAAATATFLTFERLAAALAAAPDAPGTVETLRHELHRVRGTAGSYGYMEASRLAAAMEERVLAWIGAPELERDRRGALVADFALALRLAFDADDARRDVPAAPAAPAAD